VSAEKFIADRITLSSKGKNNISKPIVKIGITGIALGISVMILTISIVLGFKKEIINKITGITSHISISSMGINSSNERDPVKLSADTLKIIKSLPFIKHIQPIAIKNCIIKTKTENEGVLLKGVASDYDFTFLKQYITQGELPKFNDSSASKDILLPKKLADKLDVQLGQKLIAYFVTKKKLNDTTLAGSNYVEFEQRSRAFNVCGIINTGFAEFDNNLAIIDIKQIQKLNYWSNNEAGSYELYVRDFNQLEENTEVIQDIAVYNYQVLPVNESYASIFSWLEMVDVNGVIIITLMLLVAGVNMITALLILILERANMVGLVKSMGMSNASVRKIFFYVSLKLLSRGLIIGNFIGIGVVLTQYFTHLVKLNSDTYYVEFVPVIFNLGYIVLLNLGIILSCLLMMFFPTLILTRLTPIKTLRFD
jgi:lipoprotein-releasing system permease protein